MTAPVTEEHIAIAARIARILYARFSDVQPDLDELVSDALLGLTLVALTWEGDIGPEYNVAIWFKARDVARSGIRKLLWRRRRASMHPFTYDDSEDEYEEDTDPRLASEDNTYAQAIARLELLALRDALAQEREVVREAVLRSSSDADIARRYGLADGNSLRQYRARFLRDFSLSQESGRPFVSTGRRRS